MVINIGTYDVNNFGDLLFPYILDHFIEEKVLHFSPTGNKTLWNDAIDTISLSKLDKYAKEASAIIIGGGHLISDKPTYIQEYNKKYGLNKLVYLSLWVLPSLIASKYKIPIIWNSLGVQKTTIPGYNDIRNTIFKNITYLSVRDKFSQNILSQKNIKCKLIIDTATQISRVFPSTYLKNLYNSFKDKNNIFDQQTAVFSMKERYLDCDLEKVLQSIKRISTTLNVIPVFIPLGQCHGDEKLLKKISKIDFGIILKEYSIKLVLSLIAHSQFYCGSSLHGYISSISYKKKAIIIANEQFTSFKKFSGYLDFSNRKGNLIKSWTMTNKIIHELNKPFEVRKNLCNPLEKHWTEINYIISSKKQNKTENLYHLLNDHKLCKELIKLYK